MSEPFIGEITMVGFSFPPRGWAFCDGTELPIDQYQSLFSLLGTTFGGNGRTTFHLPDLRGRMAVHPGTGGGHSVQMGGVGGTPYHTLSVNEMPQHSHSATVNVSPNEGNDRAPAAGILASTQDPARPYGSVIGGPHTHMHTSTIGLSGSGGAQGFHKMPPYRGLYHCIAMTGLYPSRN